MKFYKKNIRYLIIGVAFIIALCVMNRIVGLFIAEEKRIQEVDFAKYDSADSAYVYMNPFEYIDGDLLETVKCTGWAFAETNESNADKQVYLLLKGKKHNFITARCAMAVDDIHLRNNIWKSIPGNCNNFTIKFSTLNLPNDIYEIYVYVIENNNIKGIASTGQYFKKDGVFLYEYESGSICESINPDSIKSSIDYKWNTVSYVNNCVKVSGWSAIDSISSEICNYYISFVGKNNNIVTVHTPNQCRTDVADYLESPIYTLSGYTGSLSKKNLPDGKGNAFVIIEANGSYYKSDPIPYDLNQR